MVSAWKERKLKARKILKNAAREAPQRQVRALLGSRVGNYFAHKKTTAAPNIK
jgi:hypothetical protein